MKRSKHSLSHYRLTTLNQGELYPVACMEVLPGDSFRHATSALLRVSPLVAPVMHPVHVMVHHWYVPTRLLWDNWEPFITGRDPDLVTPTMAFNHTHTDAWRLAQALGCGAETVPGAVGNIVLNTFAFRAYNKIYNEFYRDQDLNQALPERTGNTGDVPADYAIRKGSWEKDYFTTARPFPQQGNNTELVQLALTGKLPVKGLGVLTTSTFPTVNQQVRESDGTTPTYANAGSIGGNTTAFIQEDPLNNDRPNAHVDLSTLQGSVTMNIEEWRRSMAMQRIREHRNRYGSRYTDYLSFLGIKSSDARLQRPEYLGGGKQTISFSEVLSTADAGDATVGDMAGHGIAALRTRPYKRFFEEHGYIISLMFIRPRTVYMNRVPRHFLRRDYEQYWQKELEMLGEQPISNFEIYGDSLTPSAVFGYNQRYDEYRHEESFVTGEFRTILDYWHMGRKFTSQPALNGTFVAADPTNRIYASAINDEIYAMVAHRISARRLVSKRARA